MWDAGQGGVCASDAAFLASSDCCSLAIFIRVLFTILFANLFRDLREKRKASCFLLDVFVGLSVSFFTKNLQMPFKKLCE